MQKIAITTSSALFSASLMLTMMLNGCGKAETKVVEETTGVKTISNPIELLNNGAAARVPGPASPGGSPTFGTQTGTGFSTGDAANAGGQGSGMMGYHGTGSMGTSHAISDEHPLPPPLPGYKEPVLPAQ